MKLTPPLSERYRIVDTLGGGGQAQVLRAEDTRTGAVVALKLVRTKGQADLEERFLREVRALSGLTHPNLVRFLDAFPEHDPPVLVMEVIEGESLAERVALTGTLNRDETRALGVGVAGALHLLHSEGFAHRDVKPENVLLAEGRGPVLVDLGLVRDESQDKLTRTGALLGTPAYLPPEVFRLQRGGAPADVFALGVVLFECLTGERPFTYMELVATGKGHRLPSGPRERLTTMFGKVVGACLAEEPGERPDASTLERALAGRTTRDTLDQIQRSLVRSASASRPVLPPPRRLPSQVPVSPEQSQAAPPVRTRRPGPLLGLVGVGALALGALLLLRPGATRPLPSLRLSTTPFELLAEWSGEEGGPDTELVLGDGRRVGLPAGAGTRSATFPLEEPTRIRVLRGGTPVPFGVSGETERVLKPADLPPPAAARWTLGPDGLTVRLPGAGWAPERLRFRQGDGARTAPSRMGESSVEYVLEHPLVGDEAVEVEAMGRVQGGAYRRVGPPAWLRRSLAPEVLPFRPDPTRMKEGPFVPDVQAPLTREVETGLPWDPSAPAYHLRTVVALHPGMLRAPYRGKPYWWGIITDSSGTWMKGVPEDADLPLLSWPHRRGTSPGGAGLVPLAGALGLVTKESRKRGDPRFSWRVLRPDGKAEPAESILESSFVPITGGIPLPGGGALFLSRRLRILVADETGRLLPPTGHPSEAVFRARRGTSRVNGRYRAFAGRWGPSPPTGTRETAPDRGWVIVDLEARDVLACVAGVPGPGPAHPAVLAEGPARGLYALVGRELVKVDLDGLTRAVQDPRRPLTFSELESGGLLTRSPGISRDDVGAADPLRYSRSEVAVDGAHAALLALDTEEPPGGEASARLKRLKASLRRWVLFLISPGGTRRLSLDRGPFAHASISFHQALVSLDAERGLAATIVEGADDRWAIALHSLATGRPLVEWSLRPRRGIRSPTFTPRGLMVETHREVLIYPYPAESGG